MTFKIIFNNSFHSNISAFGLFGVVWASIHQMELFKSII